MTNRASPSGLRRSPRFSHRLINTPDPTVRKELFVGDSNVVYPSNQRITYNGGHVLNVQHLPTTEPLRAGFSCDADQGTTSGGWAVPASREDVCGSSTPYSPTARVLQLHSSLEPIAVPTSVDIHPYDDDNTPIQPGSDAEAQISLVPMESGRSNSPKDSERERENSGTEDEGGARMLSKGEIHNGEVRASEADDVSAVYSFFSNLSVKQLRSVLKEWRWKQTGNKHKLVARAFVHLQIMKLSGTTISEAMFSHRDTVKFDSWLSQRKTLDLRSPLYLSRAPCESELFQHLEVREVEDYKRKKLDLERVGCGLAPINNEIVGSSENANQPISRAANTNQRERVTTPETSSFSINEFARLCIIMRDDEDAKCAFGGTGQELRRSQIDASFTRDSYWGVIESRFNDSGLRLHLNMTGNVDDVDSAKPPPCHRSASFLKEKFLDARRSYTVRLENWAVSGQNDNADFKRFAGTRNNELTTEGKRNMVLFVCSRKGTDYEDTRFANMGSLQKQEYVMYFFMIKSYGQKGKI